MPVSNESKFASLKEKEREARKQIIIESALALFAKKPYYEVGMRDVAEEAGVSPATLYRYFPSQEDLFVQAFIEDISSVTRSFEGLMAKDAPVTIEDFAVTYVDHLVQNESTFQMMSYIMLKDNMEPEALKEFGTVTRIFFDNFTRLLERYGVRRDTRLYAQSFIGALSGIIMSYRNYPGKDKKEIREHILKLTRLTARLYSDQLIPVHS